MYVCLSNGINSENTKRAWERYMGHLMSVYNVYFLKLGGGYMIIYYFIHLCVQNM